MTENTLDRYLLQTPVQSVKRSRSYSSPEGDLTETNMAGDKVGDLTRDELMASLGQLMDLKLANLATKDDFKGLSDQVSLLADENKVLKSELKELKMHAETVSAKLLDLEGRSRRNNLIFKGLKCGLNESNFTRIVGKFCTEHLGCDENIWVNRAHPLGKNRDMIIAHLPSDSDIETIMSRTGRLKGSGYVVHRDYPREVRERRSYLMAVRAEVERVAGRRRMPLSFDHLTIEGTRFTWEGGKLRAGSQDGARELQALINHDLTDFVKRLSERGPERPRRETPGTSGPQQQHRQRDSRDQDQGR